MAEGFSIAEGFVEIFSRIDQARNRRNASEAGDDAADSFVTRMGKGLVSGIASSILPAIGAVMQVGLVAVPAMVAAGTAVWNVGAAAIAAAPAIIAVGVAFKLVTATITALMPAIKKSLSPIGDALKAATEEAGTLASKGIRPLAQEFVKLNMPAIRTFMNQIARSTNGVVRETLSWLNTIPGQRAITNILGATGAAFQRMSPHLSGIVQSFIAMLGRIAGVSLAAGESGLTGVLKSVSGWLDRITAESVQQGLDDLRATFQAVSGAVQTVGRWIGVAVGFYRDYRTEIMLLSDVLGVLAIVFGGPVTAIVAAVGLIIRHFDTVKAAVQNLMMVFRTSTEGPAFLNNLRTAVETVVPAVQAAFKAIWAAIGPTLAKIWKQITTELIPAFGEFVAAAAPLVAFFVEKMVPIISNAMDTVLKVISGVITVITGIFKVFTGLLRGDWNQVWAGIKQIMRGAATILISIARGIVTGVKAALSLLGTVVKGIFDRAVSSGVKAFRAIVGKVKGVAGDAKNAIIRAFSNAGNWLADAGRKVISGLIGGIKGKITELRNTLGNVTNMIPDWKGPADKDAKLLTPAGGSIMNGLMKGIVGKLPALRKVLGDVTRVVGSLPGVSKGGLPGAVGRVKTPVYGRTPYKVGPGGKETMPSIGSGGSAGGAGDSANSGGLTINHLTIQLRGILDPTDPASTRRMIAALFELLKSYEKEYA